MIFNFIKDKILLLKIILNELFNKDCYNIKKKKYMVYNLNFF